MNRMEQLTAKMQELRDKAMPWIDKVDKGYRKAKDTWTKAWPWIWQARKVLLSIPVVYLMFYFARLNWNVLPAEVGLHLQSSGEYAKYISKELAVYGPLGVTSGCLAMMFLTRKTLYPWMICMFSILLPALILITNIFPS